MPSLSPEETEWCAENIHLLRRMMEGDWRAVPVRPAPEMVSAMAVHRGKELMQWYAAINQVPDPTTKPVKRRVLAKA